MNELYKCRKILGFKIKTLDPKKIKNAIANLITKNNNIEYQGLKRFLYGCSNNLTIDEKIRILAQSFYQYNGYYPNLKNPKSFNEKLLWMLFNYRHPDRMRIIDKYTFKSYVEQKIGKGYTTPLLAVYDDIEDLNFDNLPNRFVVKTTRGTGGKAVKIVKNKNECDLDKLKFEISKYLNWWNSEIFMGLVLKADVIKERIIVEEYLEDIDDNCGDYKFFCFHGKAKFFYLTNNWATNKTVAKQTMTYYDLEGNPLPFVYGAHPKSDKKLETIANFDKMVEIAEKLSADFPFIRVDLYNTGSKIYVGELTFMPGGGFGKYDPVEWDYKFGEWIDLNKIPAEDLVVLPEFEQKAKLFLSEEKCKCAEKN